jgi:hypothetical protein
MPAILKEVSEISIQSNVWIMSTEHDQLLLHPSHSNITGYPALNDDKIKHIYNHEV